jgi:hypothetical protein
MRSTAAVHGGASPRSVRSLRMPSVDAAAATADTMRHSAHAHHSTFVNAGYTAIRRVISAVLLVAAVVIIWPGDVRAQLNCQSLQSFSFPNTTINGVASMPGGPYVAADTWHLAFANLPPWCQVTATIAPTPDSSIGVQVWLPMQRYNGRYLGTGNGGYAGGYFQSELAQGINNGFATANTDMGATGGAGVNGDALVGHPEKWIDFGWRATHLMTTFSQALIQAFYGASANRSYFAGCSTGEQQALMEAQRFPNDYDGISRVRPLTTARIFIRYSSRNMARPTDRRLQPVSYRPANSM